MVSLMAGALFGFAACTSRTTSMNQTRLTDFATRYAAAWSSQHPDSLASYYAETGSLTVNAGAPSVGRAAITATAQGYMSAFPDMVVKMASVSQQGSHAIFHWTWTGTNTGPGGTGKAVSIRGYEEWTIGPDGLIAESKGHFDEAEYQRQLKSDAPSAN
jgi:steroid delta-isomerase-like uncharacterized protein